MAPSLSILGVGIDLPPRHDTRELARQAGGDPTAYRGWDHIRVAAAGDEPSTMSARALDRALTEAGIQAEDLRLVLFAGMSRDFLPSWSVATEVMKLCGTSSNCLGLDMTVGCLSTLSALQIALGWLITEGGGYAAVVTAEKWTYTVERNRTDRMPYWGHSDGGGALVVGHGAPGRSLAEFKGAAYTTEAKFNGGVLIPWGGTKHPVAPEGVVPYYRQRGAEFGLEIEFDVKDTKKRYMAGYTRAAQLLRERFKTDFDRLVSNQISTGIVAMLPGIFQVAPEKSVVTGHDSGHLGPADVIVALRQLIDSGQVDGPVAMAASTAYGYGAGLITPPGA